MGTTPHPVLGRYQPDTLLGRGATSTVRRAVDLRGGPDVAVKSIPADPDLLARAEVEVCAAQRLDHPGIVALRDWGREGDQVHLVWELVEGPNLREAVADTTPQDGWCCARIAEVMESLAHAHARHVVHRDIKPANVLLDRHGNARLSDFGVARLLDRTGITMVGDIVGTAAYMAPEQARGREVTPATDVYAASLLLYELLTGVSPFNAREPLVAMRRAALGERTPLDQARPDLAPRLVQVVEAGLSLDPERRPPAARMAQELRDLATTLTPSTRRGALARRALPVLAPAAAWSVATAAALWSWTHTGALRITVAALAVLALCARAPIAGAGAAVAACSVLLGRISGGAGVLLAVVGGLAVLAGARWPRLLPAPLLAPLAASIGLIPAAFAGAALLRTWRQRVWAVGTGLVLTLAWQLWLGGIGVLLGPDPARPGQTMLAGEGNPFRVIDQLRPELQWRWVGWQALALAAFALITPLLLRIGDTTMRVLATLVLVGGLAAVCVGVTPGQSTHVAAALIPSAVVLVVWAMRPWRTLPRLSGDATSATLREPLP
ncbi:MAG: serine/threonine-protein kinase [Thermoleophilia bacterium]